MPHLILEYSNNIITTENFNQLFDKLHHLLEKELPTQLSSCKSRCMAHSLFFIGDQDENNAFVHLTIKILAGRADAKKSQIGEKILLLLNDFFRSGADGLNINFSVEIMDLDKNYFKG